MPNRRGIAFVFLCRHHAMQQGNASRTSIRTWHGIGTSQSWKTLHRSLSPKRQTRYRGKSRLPVSARIATDGRRQSAVRGVLESHDPALHDAISTQLPAFPSYSDVIFGTWQHCGRLAAARRTAQQHIYMPASLGHMSQCPGRRDRSREAVLLATS
jgi:hypothetical protein